MCPVVLTRGADQAPVSTRFQMREDESVMRNYGRMLVDLAAAIPDGIVAFFVSYSYMDKIVSKWNELGVLQARAPPAAGPLAHDRPIAHLAFVAPALLCLGAASKFRFSIVLLTVPPALCAMQQSSAC